MKRSYILILAIIGTVMGATAVQAQCPTFHTLTNGSPASAMDVMDNFNNILNCGAFTNVGINKSPSYVLDVNSAGYSNGTMAQFDNQYGNGGGVRFAYYGTTELWLGEGGFISPNLSAQDIGMVARGSLLFDTGTGHGRPPLFISASGNVSVGYTSPQALFDLTGNVAGSSGATADAIRFTDLSGNANSRNWLVGNGADSNFGDFAFLVSNSSGGSPGGTPALTLARNGNVGISTANPSATLEVAGQTRLDTLAGAASTPLCITATSNGVVATCSSSIRYKENVKNAAFGLKEIRAMRPVTFKWKGREEQDFGLIAEEVAKIDPRYVTYKDGKIEGVKYPQLTAVLVNAIKEIEAKNERQAQQISLQAKEISSQQTEISLLRDQQDGRMRQLGAEMAAMQRRLALQTAKE